MEKSKIEWTDSTYNPVTGCYNNCPYCYARRIANRLKGCDNCPSGICPSLVRIIELSHRLQATSKDGKKRSAAYPFGFTPTLHEYRLDDPKSKGFGKNVFVCSMADLFGPWVPDSWIERVFRSCLDAPGHRYLFLTKNPIRYAENLPRQVSSRGGMTSGTEAQSRGRRFPPSMEVDIKPSSALSQSWSRLMAREPAVSQIPRIGRFLAPRPETEGIRSYRSGAGSKAL